MDHMINLEELFHERAESAERTLHKISTEELEKLLHGLFLDDPTHPWYEQCLAFAKEHAFEQTWAGEVSDGYSFVFNPEARRGLWFRYHDKLEAVGMLGPRGIQALSEMVRTKEGL